MLTADSETSETSLPYRLYDLDAAAKILMVSRAEMARAVARGSCDSLKLGRLRRISARQLAAYVARLERGEVA